MSSLDVVGSEGLTSDSKPQEDTEPYAISNTNPILKPFSLIECEKGYWILPRSGTTLRPSTDDRGVESWIFSLRESRVSLTLTPESDVASRMIETYGLICGASQAKWNRESLSWKTSQVSLVDLKPMDFRSSESSNRWVMSFSNELYLPEASELHTYENESSLSAFGLPTITASDASQGAVIGEQDTFYQTPKGRWRKINKKGTDGSAGLARELLLNLPTPSASDAEGGATETATWKNGRMIRVSDTTGTEFGAKLRDLAKTHEQFCPPSMPSNKSEALKNSSEDPIYLNPSFGEAMMGFPIDWSALSESETLSFLKSLAKSRSKSKP
jgi:hypothetical protein